MRTFIPAGWIRSIFAVMAISYPRCSPAPRMPPGSRRLQSANEPRMSCLERECRESKTFSLFLRVMLTHSGLCVLRVSGFRVVFGAYCAGATITGGGNVQLPPRRVDCCSLQGSPDPYRRNPAASSNAVRSERRHRLHLDEEFLADQPVDDQQGIGRVSAVGNKR